MNSNNWYVITGAPHSGKSTLARLLAKQGYKIVNEAARVYIDNEIKKGRSLEQIRKDEVDFQKKVLDIKIEIENKMSKDEIIFFDRGIPDSDAYYKLQGVEIDEYLEKAMKNCVYKKIFLLDYFPYKKDYARVETEEEQILLHKLLEESYQKTDALIIKVPKITKEERLKFVLNNL